MPAAAAASPRPPLAAEIRAPWPDELPRLQHYLPAAFLHDAQPPWTLVAVKGRVERLVAAAAYFLRSLQEGTVAWLMLRVDDGPERNALAAALLTHAREAAWSAGADRLVLGQSVDEDSPAAEALLKFGFVPDEIHERYETPTPPFWERLNRIYERMRARGMIPSQGVTLTTLQPGVIGAVRNFLTVHIPGSASSLAMESANFKPEHSLALLVRGEVKGVVLCRRAGPVIEIGLRLIAPELRGGIAWANLVLLHATIGAGVGNGLEVNRFELNPEQHEDTRQMAQLGRAKFLGRRLLLGIGRAEHESRRKESD